MREKRDKSAQIDNGKAHKALPQLGFFSFKPLTELGKRGIPTFPVFPVFCGALLFLALPPFFTLERLALNRALVINAATRPMNFLFLQFVHDSG